LIVSKRNCERSVFGNCFLILRPFSALMIDQSAAGTTWCVDCLPRAKESYARFSAWRRDVNMEKSSDEARAP
jgi:hypothetical protein